VRVAGPTDLQHPATASTYTSDSLYFPYQPPRRRVLHRHLPLARLGAARGWGRQGSRREVPPVLPVASVQVTLDRGEKLCGATRFNNRGELVPDGTASVGVR